MPKKRPPIAPMHPREKLTRKAYRAIYTYTEIKCRDLLLFDFAVRYTLEAERMSRAKLYAFLEQRGYRWDGRLWLKKSNPKEPTVKN